MEDLALPRKGVFEESRVTFRVLPTDCDINFHMNNGRYLSFMDLGRLHLIAQIGLLRDHRPQALARRCWRRRRSTSSAQLAPFQKFDLVTRVVTWDDKYAYMEQRFESDGVLCAHAFAKGLFLDERQDGSAMPTVVAGAGLHGRAAADAGGAADLGGAGQRQEAECVRVRVIECRGGTYHSTALVTTSSLVTHHAFSGSTRSAISTRVCRL